MKINNHNNMADATLPFSDSCSGIVSCLEYGPHYQLSTLLALGTSDNRLCIKQSTVNEGRLQTVSNVAEALHQETFLDIPLSSPQNRIRRLSWSPESILTESNLFIRLAVLLDSNKLCLVTNNGEETNITEMNDVGHTKSINDVVFHSSDRGTLATVGDDSTVRVWDMEVGVVVSSLRLLSPGVTVRFHPLEPHQLMVAEKGGRVCFYNTSIRQPIRTAECPKVPLLQADWSLANSSKVGAVAGSNWYLWDVSQSSLPSEMGVAHNMPSLGFKWCNGADNLFSTFSSSGQFRIHHSGHKKGPLVTYQAPVTNDMSWHPSLPIVALATNRRMCFWGVDI